MFKPITVTDKQLKFLQDAGVVGKEPVKFATVSKADVPQMVPQLPQMNHKVQSMYIVDPDGSKHKII